MLLLLVPFALVLVVISVLGLAGMGPLTNDRRADRDGLLGAVGPVVGLLVGIGVIALAAISSVLFFGLRGDGGPEADDERDRPAAVATTSTTTLGTTTTTTATASTTTLQAPTRRGGSRVASLGPEVAIEADQGATFPESYDVADQLRSGTVLQVHVRGYKPFARAIAEQCVPTVTDAVRCSNEIPVQLDAEGEARFQYLVSTDVVDGNPVPGGCRADAAPCSIVVRSVNGERRGEIQTIFGDAIAAPGRITVTPSTGLALAGETVTVEVDDYPPGAQVTAMLCAAPDATGTRCGEPGPAAVLVVGRDGTGRTGLFIEPGPVGSERISCGRGDDCGISVASDDVFARAPVVPITFAAPPGADYDPTRLALGLAIAAVLIAIATWLIIRTDWSAVGEAAAPEIDDVEYADLDAIIAALPPEEDDELVGSRGSR